MKRRENHSERLGWQGDVGGGERLPASLRRKLVVDYIRALSRNAKKRNHEQNTRGMKEKTQESYVQIIGALGREEIL